MTPATPAPAIALTNLTVRYDLTKVLRQISLTVYPGDVVALLGANGSGKSSLVKAALGIIPRSAGSVQLNGIDLGRKVIWHQIGYVPQRSSATSGVPTTAAEVVATGLLAGRRWRPGRNAKATIAAALAEVGLADRAQTCVGELSGGQQQRVLIARALVRNPKIAFLDEPATGLDAAAQDQLTLNLIRRRQAGLAAIIVLHELGPFEPLITRTVMLSEGTLTPLPPAAATPDQPNSIGHDPFHQLGDPHHPHDSLTGHKHGPGLELEP